MKEKFLDFFTTIFLGIFLAAIFINPDSAKSQSQNLRIKSHLKFDNKFSGKASVIDGDSLKVDGKEVRLFGIDAPEYAQTCFDSNNSEYSCGKISRFFLIKLVSKKNVECLYAQKDKYDRFLSKCTIEGISINEALIKNGMAVIYDFTEADDKMIELEKSAKEQKLGIWKGAFQLPKEYRKAHPRTN